MLRDDFGANQRPNSRFCLDREMGKEARVLEHEHDAAPIGGEGKYGLRLVSTTTRSSRTMRP